MATEYTYTGISGKTPQQPDLLPLAALFQFVQSKREKYPFNPLFCLYKGLTSQSTYFHTLYWNAFPPSGLSGTKQRSKQSCSRTQHSASGESRTRFTLSYTGDSEMRTLANSEDPNEMPHEAAFYQGLCYLLRQKRSTKNMEKERRFPLEIIDCDPSIYS